MRWRDLRQSGNVEDRRGMGAGMGGPVFRTGGLGLGGLLVLLLLGWVTGTNPLQFLSEADGTSPAETSAPAPTGPPADDAGKFAASILADTEDAWTSIFTSAGRRYSAPKLVLFDEAVQSACGTSTSAVGPFYCPTDQAVYIDLSFYRDLDKRFGAPGDFAQAYVIAHEVGHHVQNLAGVLGGRDVASQRDANVQSVRQELQADCLAGVWGHTAAVRDILEAGDVEEGLNAAAAIGDDRLQRRSQGQVMPESFTHGSSQQRVAAFKSGLTSGDPAACGLNGFGR